MLNETPSHEWKRLCQEFLDAAIVRLDGKASVFGWSEKDFTCAFQANANTRREREKLNRGGDDPGVRLAIKWHSHSLNWFNPASRFQRGGRPDLF